MKRLPYLLAAVALASLLLVAWLQRGSFLPVNVGSEAPSFTAYDLEGNEVTLSDYRGTVRLVNVWATWCPPCKREMPSMQRLHDELEAEGFRILAVSVDAPRGEEDEFGRPGGDIQAFADSLGLTFTILHDPSGEIQDIYSTTGVPESFVIGRDGVIYKKVIGATEWDSPEYKELIRRLLESGPRSGTD